MTTDNWLTQRYDEFMRSERSPYDLLDHVEDVEPREGLLAIGILRHYLDERESDLVVKAEVEGIPWSEVARRLGRSIADVVEQFADPQYPPGDWG